MGCSKITRRGNKVQLNTRLRHSHMMSLSTAEMDEIEAAFAGLPVLSPTLSRVEGEVEGLVLNVYKAARPEVVLLDEEETRRRRPQQEAERR